jgi:ABC-2 type transport system permease protein
MTRAIRLLVLYTRRSFLQWTAFRSFLFTLVVNQAVTPLLGLAIWSAALPGQDGISTYYAALLAVQLMTVSYEYHTVTMGIYEGNLNEWLLRPHQVVIAPLAENIATRIWHLCIGLPAIVAVITLTRVSFDVPDVLAAIPALTLAAILRFLFVYTLAISAIWSQQAGGITELGSTLIFLFGGMAVPISLFPDRVRPIGEALPFRAMLGFPAEIATGNLGPAQVVEGYGWQLLWLAVLLPVAKLAWNTGLRRYTALGG